MANDFNWDDYEKVTDPTNNSKTDESFNWDDFEKVSPDISKTESGLRAGAQGLTFNLADEATGVGQALVNTAFGDDKWDDFNKTVRKHIDESRANYDAAEKANPSTYLAGEIAGGIIPAFLTGGVSTVANLGKVGVQQGLKGLAYAGAKHGALSALGSSEADLLTGDIGDAGQALVDTVAGGAIGTASGVVIPTIGKTISKGVGAVVDTAKDSNLFRKFVNAKDLMSRTGKSIVGKESKELLQKDSIDIAKALRTSFEDQIEGANKKITQSFENLKDDNFAKEANDYLTKLTDGTLRNEDQAQIQRVYNDFMNTKVTQTTEKGVDKALKEVELMMLKGKSALKGNPNASVDYSPIENIDNKFLQTTESKKMANSVIGQTPTSIEGSALSEANNSMNKKIALAQAKAKQTNESIIIGEPIFDKESNSLITSIASQDGTELKPLVQSVGKDTTFNTPILGDQISSNPIQVNIPEDKIIETTTKELRPLNASQFYDLRKNLNKLAHGTELEDFGSNKLKGHTSDMKDFLMSKMSKEDAKLFAEGSASHVKARDAYKALKILNPNDTKITNDIDLGKILNTKDSYFNEKINKILDETAENVPPQVRADINDIPVRRELSDIFTDKLGFSGKFSDFISPSAFVIRSGEGVSKLTNSSVAKNVAMPVADFTKKILSIDNAGLLKFANGLKSVKNKPLNSWGNIIEKATQDSTKRDRLLWSLSQQPAFRQYIEELFKNEQIEPQN